MSQQDARRLGLILLFTPFLLWIVLLIVMPHMGIAVLSLREKIAPRVYIFSFANYIDFINEPIYWNTLLRTAVFSILVTLLTLLAGFPVAYYIAKVARKRARAALFLLCLVPLWVSDLVRAFGWIVLLRESGVVSGFLQWVGFAAQPVEMLYNDVTVVIGLIYTVILFMIVPLVSTLDGMDRQPDRGWLQSWRQPLHGVAADHCPLRHARHRCRLHHRFHADRGRLSHPHSAGRQEQHVVHGADLRSVHHPVQLGIRRGVRNPFVAVHLPGGLAGPETQRPAARHDGGKGMTR